MPKQTKYIKAQVQKLIDRASMYSELAIDYAQKADRKYRRVSLPSDAAESAAEFAYMNPDLDNWDSDGESTGAEASQAMRKEYAGLCDQATSENLDLMIETIGKMRAAGANKDDMDRAWAIYSSAQS
jgi:hypothetical protein